MFIYIIVKSIRFSLRLESKTKILQSRCISENNSLTKKHFF